MCWQCSPLSWTLMHPCSTTCFTPASACNFRSPARKSLFPQPFCCKTFTADSVWSWDSLHFCCSRRTETPSWTAFLAFSSEDKICKFYQIKRYPRVKTAVTITEGLDHLDFESFEAGKKWRRDLTGLAVTKFIYADSTRTGKIAVELPSITSR